MHGCVSSSSSHSSLRSSEGEAAVSSSRSDTACNAPSRGAGTDQAEDARNMCRLGSARDQKDAFFDRGG